MDQFAKYAADERVRYREVLMRIKNGDVSELDIKKLKSYHARYRVHIGATRIIYEVTDSGTYNLVQVGNRNDHTYRQ